MSLIMRGFYSNNNKPYQSSSGQAVDDSIHLTEFNGILAIMDEEEEEEECYKEEKFIWNHEEQEGFIQRGKAPCQFLKPISD